MFLCALIGAVIGVAFWLFWFFTVKIADDVLGHLEALAMLGALVGGGAGIVYGLIKTVAGR